MKKKMSIKELLELHANDYCDVYIYNISTNQKELFSFREEAISQYGLFPVFSWNIEKNYGISARMVIRTEGLQMDPVKTNNFTEEQENTMKQTLINTIEYEMQQIGNTNVSIENIRLFVQNGKQYALADISYTWWLNAWDKRVTHWDMIFVLDENEWKSPLFSQN